MPYKSDAQRKFFHTPTARKKGISASTVKEFDNASRGMSLPKKVGKKKSRKKRPVKAPSLKSGDMGGYIRGY